MNPSENFDTFFFSRSISSSKFCILHRYPRTVFWILSAASCNFSSILVDRLSTSSFHSKYYSFEYSTYFLTLLLWVYPLYYDLNCEIRELKVFAKFCCAVDLSRDSSTEFTKYLEKCHLNSAELAVVSGYEIGKSILKGHKVFVFSILI